MSHWEDLESFLQEPQAERAEEILLSLEDQPWPESEEEQRRWESVLVACARTPAILGSNLELLSEKWLERFWAACQNNLETVRQNLQGLRSGPFATRVEGLLGPGDVTCETGPGPSEPATPEPLQQPPPKDFKVELARLTESWNRLSSELVDLEPTVAAFRQLYAIDWPELEGRQAFEDRTYLTLTLDLGRPAHRELASLFWERGQRQAILRQLGQAFQAEELAQEREVLVGWLLGLSDASTVLLDWTGLLAFDDRDELVRRLRALHREEDAIRVLLHWLQLGLPRESGRLLSALSGLKKHWKLREQAPQLVSALARSGCEALLRLARQHRQAVKPTLQALRAFPGLEPTLESDLLEQTLASELSLEERALLLARWLEAEPESHRLPLVCRWQVGYPLAPLELWTQLLQDHPLPSSQDLASLLGDGLAPSRPLLQAAYLAGFSHRREELLSWGNLQKEQLQARLDFLWESLEQALATLCRAWDGSEGLVGRVSQVRGSAQRPELAQLCPALWESPPGLPPTSPATDSTVLQSSYAQEHWCQWTALPWPQEELTTWLKASGSTEELAELAFAWARSHLEGEAPEADIPDFLAFLRQICLQRPEVADWLRKNVGDALGMLPFPHPLSAAETSSQPGSQIGSKPQALPAFALEDLLQLYDDLCALRVRQQQERENFEKAAQADVVRKLGPALDNLEQYLLPFFQFRQMLAEVWGLHPAVAALNQSVPQECLGSRVRQAGQEQGELFSCTLGLRLAHEEDARWPAYASPRPLQ